MIRNGDHGRQQPLPNEHVVTLTAEWGWGLSLNMVCGFDRANDKRPCWPHDEYGNRFDQAEGERGGCVYEDWFGETGTECLADGWRREVLLDGAVWTGDGFKFVLGKVLPIGGKPDA